MAQHAARPPGSDYYGGLYPHAPYSQGPAAAGVAGAGAAAATAAATTTPPADASPPHASPPHASTASSPSPATSPDAYAPTYPAHPHPHPFHDRFQNGQPYQPPQAPFAFHPSQHASAYRSNPPSANPSPQRSPVHPTGATLSPPEWMPPPAPSSGHQPSLGPSNHSTALPSPDQLQQRRGSDQYSNGGRRASDAFLARRTNEVLAMNDQPMVRHGSDMGVPPPLASPLGDGRVGVDEPYAERSYTELKVLGDGSFGTVWLCDWHSPVKGGTALSAMQCGAGARPEWAGKRLVALKRMKRVWHGGWREARTLGELTSLRDIPPHPAVIPLLDAFISPRSRELYFVFECMEGNLYQMTKSRKGRPLAAGLIASCFQQIASGLFHIHRHGYFHRDMKPENLLVTTTGLCDYLSNDAVAEINARRDAGQLDAKLPLDDPRIFKDIQVIVKLADFGLARAITSKPPYTEYVSTRWYRAPEVLLRSSDYGAPVDMWALGTILAEMLNLKPMFPGGSEIDQIHRITEVLGDPVNDYGVDQNRDPIGGGQWPLGVKMGKKVGFNFPPRKPHLLKSMFPPDTPRTLVHCINRLLRYDPRERMTSTELMDHPYFHEVLPHLQRMVPPPPIPFTQGQPPPQPRFVQQARPVQAEPAAAVAASAVPAATTLATADLSHLAIPPHVHHRPVGVFGNGDMRTLPPPIDFSAPAGEHYQRPDVPDTDPWYYTLSPLVYQLRQLDLPTADLASYGQRRWSEEQSRRASLASVSNSVRRPSIYEGSVAMASEHSNHSLSNMSLNSMSLNRVPSHQSLQRAAAAPYSQPQQQQQQQQTSPHVMAFVRQQQQQQQQQQPYQQTFGQSQSTPNLAQPGQPLFPPGTHGSMNMVNASTSALPTGHQPSIYNTPSTQSVKKKKWGLSAVFSGGTNKSNVSLSSVDENGYAGSSASLKRTQSGHKADDREGVAGLSQVTTPPNAGVMDAKSAKKDAARRVREAARAKRDEAERLQKERARAVLDKRNKITSDTIAPTAVGEMEYVEDKSDSDRHSVRGALGGYRPGYGSQQSLGSQRSYSSLVVNQSPYGVGLEGDGGRNKARKTAEDDDHSSIGRTSAASRSMLSVASFGTIDSDPGPRRARDIWPDQGHGRRTSSTYRGMSASNVSLESQLASQLARQATVASASESSLSLGRHAGRAMHGEYRTEPVSPHGQPTGYAVSRGSGIRRHASRARLPSIGDWEGLTGGAETPTPTQVDINPMFRVPSATGHGASKNGHDGNENGHDGRNGSVGDAHGHGNGHANGTTLPPFSAIASMATNTPQPQNHPSHLHSIPRPHQSQH